jgi:pimeloyl-ACP methyl ester carboxylesterase
MDTNMGGTIEATDYWAQKGDVRLSVYRKRLAGAGDQPILFLVHGSSFGGKSGFDLDVPGKPGYSFMDEFARRGFDVWTMDFEGYGRSSRTQSNSNLSMAAEDLRAGTDVVFEVTGKKTAMFYGSSSGALRAALFGEAYPDRVERVILDAFVYTGEGAPTLIKRRERLEEWRSSHVRKADRAFFHSIFNRDLPGTSEEGIADALADAELAQGDTLPTGTYLDMCANLPVVTPEKLRCPVMIVRGEHDGIATEEDLLNYFAKLGTNDRRFVMIPGMAHVSYLSKNRAIFFQAMEDFLRPPARAM